MQHHVSFESMDPIIKINDEKKPKKPKNRTWSIAHGMRHGTSSLIFSPNMHGKDELTAGAAWIAGKLIFPMESVSVKPKIPEK